MNLSYVVDSGASRGALPSVMFKKRAPSRTAEISTSNGAADTNVYAATTMPRLQQGQAAAEKREVLGINGPPVLPLGYQVETSKGPAAFVYTQEWQGFVWGDGVKRVAGAV